MTIGWDRINAYVDRELDAAEAAAVASAIARDPSLGARVATLSKLKAEAAGLPAPDGAPPVALCSGGGRRVTRWRPLAMAAFVAFVFIVGGAAWLARAPAADPLAATVAAERTWLSGATPETSGDGVRVAVETRANDTLPDLSAAGLRLAYLAAAPGSIDRRGVFAGYVGPNGCRLGLWVGHGTTGPAGLERVEVDGVGVRRWSADGARYALISRGMDARRLDRFAAIVADIVGRAEQPDERLRTALRDAAGVGAACAG
jgi:anti-sigma factor RsiW